MFNRSKLYHGVLGLAIGDALGVPVEFSRRESLKHNKVTDMTSGVWHQPKGTWSDDTAMTLATIDALNKHNWEVTDKCLYDIMENFRRWYYDGEYAAFRNRFDIGNTCKKAILDWNKHTSTSDEYKCCGVAGEAYGNGALMRILPSMFIDKVSTVADITSLTHNNYLCKNASLFYILILRELLKGENKIDAYKKAVNHKPKIVNGRLVRLGELLDLTEDEINSSGYVVDTLEAAVWCFLTTENYEECVLKAVNLGGDTDTVGAVAGGLAGIYYGIGGEKGIKEEWIYQLRDESTLRNICYRL